MNVRNTSAVKGNLNLEEDIYKSMSHDKSIPSIFPYSFDFKKRKRTKTPTHNEILQIVSSCSSSVGDFSLAVSIYTAVGKNYAFVLQINLKKPDKKSIYLNSVVVALTN